MDLSHRMTNATAEFICAVGVAQLNSDQGAAASKEMHMGIIETR